MNIVFISDFFVEHVPGGGELNNEELISLLIENGHQVKKIQSHLVTTDHLNKCEKKFFIISNFVNLGYECRALLYRKLKYVIYEHDHKYLASRDPAKYKDFKAPSSEIRNYSFYKNAVKVVCQSNFHKNIVEDNLDIDNIISAGGNLWSPNILEKLREFSKKDKKSQCSIMNSNIPHKNTHKAAKYCELKNKKYELVSDSNYIDFLDKMSNNNTLVFLPGTPETLSRIVVEARMMGMSVITNNLVGASRESWFNLKGEELIQHMIDKRAEICRIFQECFSSDVFALNSESRPLISIITTFHKADEHLESYMRNITEQVMFKDCELIIIDAASPGGETRIVKKYMQRHKNIVYKRYEEKMAITPCLTIAAKLARAQYLTFAFVGDVKKKNCLETLYKNIIRDSGVSLVYGDVVQTNNPDETFENIDSMSPLFEHSTYEFSKENMVKCLPGPMPLWNKTIHDSVGFFDEVNCDFADDWDMWLRAVNNGHRFKKVRDVVGLYLTGGRSQQQNNPEQKKEEAKIFFKYGHLFGNRFNEFKDYFGQFLR